MRNVDYYAVLGLKSDASEDEVKRAYRDLSRRYHPDTAGTNAEASTDQFIRITQAYHAIINGEEPAPPARPTTPARPSSPVAASPPLRKGRKRRLLGPRFSLKAAIGLALVTAILVTACLVISEIYSRKVMLRTLHDGGVAFVPPKNRNRVVEEPAPLTFAEKLRRARLAEAAAAKKDNSGKKQNDSADNVASTVAAVASTTPVASQPFHAQATRPTPAASSPLSPSSQLSLPQSSRPTPTVISTAGRDLNPATEKTLAFVNSPPRNANPTESPKARIAKAASLQPTPAASLQPTPAASSQPTPVASTKPSDTQSSRPTPAVISTAGRDLTQPPPTAKNNPSNNNTRFLASLRNDSGGDHTPVALPGTSKILADAGNDKEGVSSQSAPAALAQPTHTASSQSPPVASSQPTPAVASQPTAVASIQPSDPQSSRPTPTATSPHPQSLRPIPAVASQHPQSSQPTPAASSPLSPSSRPSPAVISTAGRDLKPATETLPALVNSPARSTNPTEQPKAQIAQTEPPVTKTKASLSSQPTPAVVSKPSLVAASQPTTAASSQTSLVASSRPTSVASSQPTPVASSQPTPAAASQPSHTQSSRPTPVASTKPSLPQSSRPTPAVISTAGRDLKPAQQQKAVVQNTKPAAELPNAQTAPAQPESAAQLQHRLNRFLSAYCQAYGSRNLTKFKPFFTPKATENGTPISNLMPTYSKLFASTDTLTLQISTLKWHQPTDGQIALNGRFTIDLHYRDSGPVHGGGKIDFLLAWDDTSFQIEKMNYRFDK